MSTVFGAQTAAGLVTVNVGFATTVTVVPAEVVEVQLPTVTATV